MGSVANINGPSSLRGCLWSFIDCDSPSGPSLFNIWLDIFYFAWHCPSHFPFCLGSVAYRKGPVVSEVVSGPSHIVTLLLDLHCSTFNWMLPILLSTVLPVTMVSMSLHLFFWESLLPDKLQSGSFIIVYGSSLLLWENLLSDLLQSFEIQNSLWDHFVRFISQTLQSFCKLCWPTLWPVSF